MHRIRTTTAALVSTAALTLAVAPVADAGGPSKEPCARQEAQVQKAEDALARVTAVFAKQTEKVKDARDDVADADSPAEETEAEDALSAAKAARATAAKVKKAQQMRLAKATERLATCQASVEDTGTTES